MTHEEYDEVEQKWLRARDILNSNHSDEQLEEAVRLIKECAENNFPGAYFSLAALYNNGKGVEQDKARAFQYAEKALELGYNRAKLLLSFYYYKGEGVEQDLEKAWQYALELAEEDNDADAYFQLATICFEDSERDVEEGLKWLEHAAKLGNYVAMARLGQIYGNMCQDDKAHFWLGKAAEAGVEHAAETLEFYNPETLPQRQVELVEYYVATNAYQKAFDFVKDNGMDYDVMTILPVDEIRTLTKEGNLDAMYELGMRYNQGRDVEQNEEVASDHFLKAAMHGHVPSTHMVGCFYLFYRKDCKTAVSWLSKAADVDYAPSVCVLGDAYMNGWGVDVDVEKGLGLITKAAELGNEQAQLNLTRIYYNSGIVEQDVETAAYWFQKYLEHDSDESHFILGGMYYNGQLFDVDYQKALEQYEIAVKRGYSKASSIYYSMLWHGDKVEKDRERLVNTYRELADSGDVAAMYKLYCIYKDEEYDGRDEATAIEYLKMSAEGGYPPSLTYMGVEYCDGGAFGTDYQKANEYFQIAAELGDSTAMCNLALSYEMGNGVEKDADKSLELYIRAAELGNSRGAVNVGKMLWDEEGNVCEGNIDRNIDILRDFADNKDPECSYFLAHSLLAKSNCKNAYSWELTEEAFGYMLQAAEAGDATAMYYVGYDYLLGRGVIQDNDEAKRWFLEAEKNGFNKEAVDEVLKSLLDGDGDSRKYWYWHDICEANPSKNIEKEEFLTAEGYLDTSAVLRGAAKCGNMYAIVSLGFSLVVDSPDEAKKHFIYAIKHGYAYFARIVGDLYYFGKSVPKNVNEAIAYYILGYNEGDVHSALALGMVLTEPGRSKDDEVNGMDILGKVCSSVDSDSEEYRTAQERIKEVEERNSSILSKMSKGIKSFFGGN